MLKSKDVAKLTGFTLRYVTMLAATGKVPAYRKGGQWRFDPEVVALLRPQPIESTKENGNSNTSINIDDL